MAWHKKTKNTKWPRAKFRSNIRNYIFGEAHLKKYMLSFFKREKKSTEYRVIDKKKTCTGSTRKLTVAKYII